MAYKPSNHHMSETTSNMTKYCIVTPKCTVLLGLIHSTELGLFPWVCKPKKTVPEIDETMPCPLIFIVALLHPDPHQNVMDPLH
jgi:hypothetical protein